MQDYCSNWTQNILGPNMDEGHREQREKVKIQLFEGHRKEQPNVKVGSRDG